MTDQSKPSVIEIGLSPPPFVLVEHLLKFEKFLPDFDQPGGSVTLSTALRGSLPPFRSRAKVRRFTRRGQPLFSSKAFRAGGLFTFGKCTGWMRTSSVAAFDKADEAHQEMGYTI